jgi:hypothetical protein
MVVNFRICGINQCINKLVQTSILIKKNYHITKLYLFVILLRNCEGLYSEGLYSYKYKPKCATKESISDS